MTNSSDRAGLTQALAKHGDIRIEPISDFEHQAADQRAVSAQAISQASFFGFADRAALDVRTSREADDDVEAFRVATIVQACASLLRLNSRLNASLNESGDALILKDYVNIGLEFASAALQDRLVLNRPDQRGWSELAAEINSLKSMRSPPRIAGEAEKAVTFTVCVLRTKSMAWFTPSVRLPEVAALGITFPEGRTTLSVMPVCPDRVIGLALSVDLRVVSPGDASEFMESLIDRLSVIPSNLS